jgi:hypothetical protein
MSWMRCILFTDVHCFAILCALHVFINNLLCLCNKNQVKVRVEPGASGSHL